MDRPISRRRFLQFTVGGATLLVTGVSLEACGREEERPGFFSQAERDTVSAAVERILPGARDARVVDYIDALLSAFDEGPPRIFAGGPFSGRTPYPDYADGSASDEQPGNAFRRFVPLSRTKEIAWRVRLYGSQAVQGGDFNDAVLGPTEGWRDQYRRGTAAIEAAGRDLRGVGFVVLAPDEQDQVLAQADPAFANLLTEHALEGMFAAPEYGGNHDVAGWSSVHYEGDSQPLGYSIFDASADAYGERPGHPMSGPNPDEDFSGFSSDTVRLLETLTQALSGKRF